MQPRPDNLRYDKKIYALSVVPYMTRIFLVFLGNGTIYHCCLSQQLFFDLSLMCYDTLNITCAVIMMTIYFNSQMSFKKKCRLLFMYIVYI